MRIALLFGLLLSGLLALVTIATPAAAKPDHGNGRSDHSSKRNEGGRGNGREKIFVCHNGRTINVSSVAASRGHRDDDELGRILTIEEFEDCVDSAFHSRLRRVRLSSNGNGDNGNDNNGGDNGDGDNGGLDILDVDVNNNHTIRVRGDGATSLVSISVNGTTVVVSGSDDPDDDGDWEIHGSWACNQNGDRRVSLVAEELNETDNGDDVDTTSVVFPCDR